MKILSLLLFFFLITSLTSCDEKTTIDTNKIYFVQNTTKSGEHSEYKIELDKEEFTIHFFNKEYSPEKELFFAAQIAALPTKKDLDAIQIGMLKTETTCFTPGTGMAAEKSGYSSLILNANGHHYLTYTLDKINRVHKVGEKNGLHKLAFDVKSIMYNGEEAPIRSCKINTLYLAILIDRNLDGIINKEDLTKVTLFLK